MYYIPDLMMGEIANFVVETDAFAADFVVVAVSPMSSHYYSTAVVVARSLLGLEYLPLSW
jgi:hypothetical protein